ncbi:MAG: hypothetical protein ACJ8F7_20110, partial [Gemmataceae bacterium]
MLPISAPILPADKVIVALQRKGAEALYHADTVRTSISFLKAGGLLSRERGEKVGQTEQYTDDTDKELGLWNKVFLDSLNIHTRLKRRNLYGPVAFVLDMKVLTSPAVKVIRSSAKNPSHWKKGDRISERWFTDPQDFEKRFNQGTAWEHSLILDSEAGILPFGSYLKEIIVDQPRQKMPGTEEDTFTFVKRHLAAHLGALQVRINCLPCSYWCRCPGTYKAMVKSFPG